MAIAAAVLRLPTAETFFGPRLRRELGQQIVDADAVHGEARWRSLADQTGLPIAYWAFHLYGGDDTASPPSETDQTSPLVVHVSHGRWLVACECGSLQHGSHLDQRFFCVSCRNATVDGRFRTVIWPDDAVAIEQELLKRPDRRHWLPHETVADLEAQTELLNAMQAA